MTALDQGQSGGPLVTFEDVTFAYNSGSTPVLTNVNFEIHRGEVVTLLGHSGCGKSTLLKMVAGLIQPVEGRCLFGSELIRGINTQVGYMTQEDTLLPWRSLHANIALPLRLKGVPRNEISDRVDAYLRLLKLEDAADMYPAQLSGGMKRRALLARSVISDPVMILMDEPFAAIDADLREDLHNELRRTVEALGQTVLFVTHDISEAALVSDRVIVLGGKPSAQAVATVEVAFGDGRDLDAVRISDKYFALQKQMRLALSHAGSSVALEGRE